MHGNCAKCTACKHSPLNEHSLDIADKAKGARLIFLWYLLLLMAVDPSECWVASGMQLIMQDAGLFCHVNILFAAVMVETVHCQSHKYVHDFRLW